MDPSARPSRPALGRCARLLGRVLAATLIAAGLTAGPLSAGPLTSASPGPLYSASPGPLTAGPLSAGRPSGPRSGVAAHSDQPAPVAVLNAALRTLERPVAPPPGDDSTPRILDPAAEPAVGGDEPVSAERITRLVAPALVNINTVIGFRGAAAAGTGIVLTPDGEVLTNNHVINGATSIKATDIGNGRVYPATVVGYDRGHDIAVLRLRGASGLRTAAIGNSNSVRVGDQIAAVGNAGGAGGKPKVARGTVSALGRTVSPRDELTGTVERLNGLIEVAASVQPGDSGGPLVNTAGDVIGVNTAASSNYQYSAAGGTGYAIPINSAMAIARQIQSGAGSDIVHVGPTGMLGVTVVGAASPGDDRSGSGLPVAAVSAGSPAAKAGLAPGHKILTFDGAEVDSAHTLTTLVVRHRPGDQVALVWADKAGQRHNATVVLMEGPPA